MSGLFHTPSFGDEDFAVDLNEMNTAATTSNWQGNNSLNESGYILGESDLLNTSEDKYETEKVEETNQMLKTKKILNEPKRPVSAYAAFFRDTQIAIKGQNPNIDFTEVSKIVSSMWEALDPEHKNVYKKNAELAKIEYMKNLAEYRANLANPMMSPTSSSSTSSSQLSQQQQEQLLVNAPTKQIPIASKPAVFTISRVISSPTDISATPTVQQTQLRTNSTPVKKINMMSPTQMENDNAVDEPNVNMLAEAGSVQKCIREDCQNRAIVNPDWEDEYCSNECVIKHCQDVFTKWIQSNSMQQTPQNESILILN